MTSNLPQIRSRIQDQYTNIEQYLLRSSLLNKTMEKPTHSLAECEDVFALQVAEAMHNNIKSLQQQLQQSTQCKDSAAKALQATFVPNILQDIETNLLPLLK